MPSYPRLAFIAPLIALPIALAHAETVTKSDVFIMMNARRAKACGEQFSACFKGGVTECLTRADVEIASCQQSVGATAPDSFDTETEGKAFINKLMSCLQDRMRKAASSAGICHGL